MIRGTLGFRDAGAIPAASIFSVHASTGDSTRHNTSEPTDCDEVASHDDGIVLRQEATVNGGSRPARATKSATSRSPHDLDLALLVAVWPELPETDRLMIVAIVRAARDLGNL